MLFETACGPWELTLPLSTSPSPTKLRRENFRLLAKLGERGVGKLSVLVVLRLHVQIQLGR